KTAKLRVGPEKSHPLRHSEPGKANGSHPLRHNQPGEAEIRDGAKDGAPGLGVAQDFASGLTPAERLKMGHPKEEEVDVGPMIHERQLQIVQSHVEDAIARGARLMAGGKALPQLGPNFFAPTILADVDHAMTIMREETFGPVLPVRSFKTEDEAVALANDSEFGLAASVFTGNCRRGEALARRI